MESQTHEMTAREAPPTPPTETVADPDAASPDAQARAGLEQELKEKEAKYLYLYAEFENYKRRQARERQDLLKFGFENAARDLLEVLDNLERALAALPPGADANLAAGLRMVESQFRSTLQKQGVQAVASVGQPFNPEFHEAMGQEPSPEHAPGVIVRELTRGYTLNGRLLRAARVTISSGAPSS